MTKKNTIYFLLRTKEQSPAPAKEWIREANREKNCPRNRYKMCHNGAWGDIIIIFRFFGVLAALCADDTMHGGLLNKKTWADLNGKHTHTHKFSHPNTDCNIGNDREFWVEPSDILFVCSDVYHNLLCMCVCAWFSVSLYLYKTI